MYLGRMDFLTLLYCSAATAFYFLPTIIGGKKRNANAIFTLNLLLGWSVIGWIVALVWATAAEPPAPVSAVAPRPVQPLAAETPIMRAARLKRLRDEGLLTQQEFMQQIQQNQ